VPLVSLAAWQALVDRAHGQPGQKVLVHAGSGGLGSTVIQLAKHLGATVATTASGENGELARRLGADVVVDYRKEDFAEVLSGYDVVLDSLGGENPDKSLAVLKPGGQAIGVAGAPDPGFAKQLGALKFMGVVMGLLSRKVRKQARKLGVSYSFHSRRQTAKSCASWPPSTTPTTYARSSTRRSRSTTPPRRSRTSSRAAPTARSSSPSTDNRQRRPPPNACNGS
jgi:NADPH:quinone reductase-like Zn-dependent oxidoreductase